MVEELELEELVSLESLELVDGLDVLELLLVAVSPALLRASDDDDESLIVDMA
jgi:hypothetical protein